MIQYPGGLTFSEPYPSSNDTVVAWSQHNDCVSHTLPDTPYDVVDLTDLDGNETLKFAVRHSTTPSLGRGNG